MKFEWFEQFRSWAGEANQDVVWLYRGQPARYETLTASQQREKHIGTYANRLRALDTGIARRLYDFLPGPIHPDVVDGLPGEDEGSAVRLAGEPRKHRERITFAELFRSLAQHYGYPTMFADMTIQPLVAAFFATHASGDTGYRPIADEPGIIYRWPALRISEVVLHLLRNNPPKDAYDVNPVLDLTRIHPAFARPRNQFAVIASLTYRPFRTDIPRDPAGNPVYEVPVDRLISIDPISLPTCEQFKLPAGAGSDLAGIMQDSFEALFPDRIDLGYSFVSVAALLSLVAIDPDIYGPSSPAEHSFFEACLSASRTLIQRESFRLLEGIPMPAPDMTLSSAALTLQLAAQKGKEAANFPAGEQARRAEIIPDIERWSGQLEDVFRYTDRLPVYLMASRRQRADLVDFFPEDPLYHKTVERQLDAVQRWNSILQELQT